MTEIIYVLADDPHLIKLIRNHFVDSGFSIDDKFINKDIVEELLNHTLLKSELSVVYKVTKSHLRLQKVKFAITFFSHTMCQKP